MAAAVQRAGLMSYTGFNYRWMPPLQHAREKQAGLARRRGRGLLQRELQRIGQVGGRLLGHERPPLHPVRSETDVLRETPEGIRDADRLELPGGTPLELGETLFEKKNERAAGDAEREEETEEQARGDARPRVELAPQNAQGAQGRIFSADRSGRNFIG